MNKNIIWGTICECGEECFVLQTEHHPWNPADLMIKIECSNCKKVNKVNREKAAAFYNHKIFSLFGNIQGSAVDFGCGEGFLTQFVSSQKSVTKLFAVDIVKECEASIKKISNDINFIGGSYHEFHNFMNGSMVNEFVSRDVLMFVDDMEDFVSSVSQTVSKRFRSLAWYMPENERVKNHAAPKEIQALFERYNWNVKLVYPCWYAYGYFIDAVKDIKSHT